VEDIKDEIWDMAKPVHPYALTFEDIRTCGSGDIIIAMLIDAKAFYEYDQRESGVEADEFDEINDDF
jgi:serine/threonine-protein phosphatase 2A regulatory subunit B''